MSIRIHRKHQDDLDCTPIVAVHLETGGTCRRVFCLWGKGVQIAGRIFTR